MSERSTVTTNRRSVVSMAGGAFLLPRGRLNTDFNPSSKSIWPTERFDSEGSNYASDSQGPTGTELTERWSKDVGDGNLSFPVVGRQGVAVTGNVGGLSTHILSPDSGRLIRTQRSEGLVGTPPAATGGRVSVAASGIDARQNALIEISKGTDQHDVGTEFPDTIVMDDRQGAIAGSQGTLTVIESGGTVSWTRSLEKDSSESTAVAMDSDTVLVGLARGTVGHRDDGFDSGTGVVAAFDRTTGERMWEQRTDTHVSTIAIAEDLVSVTTQTDVQTYRKETGETNWTAEIRGTESDSVLVDGNVLVAGYQSLRSFDLQSGEENWTVSLTGTNPNLAGYDDRIALTYEDGDSSGVSIFDLSTMNLVDEMRFESSTVSTPVVANGNVYVTTGSTVRAITTEGGE